MEKLLCVKEIMERYQCNPATARKRMREMPHMEKPLLVTEKAVAEWEYSKTVYPGEQPKKQKAKLKLGGFIPGMRLPRRKEDFA